MSDRNSNRSKLAVFAAAFMAVTVAALITTIFRVDTRVANNDAVLGTIGLAYASGQHPRQVQSSGEDHSGGNGGLVLAVRLPIPWQQVVDFVGGVIRKPRQHVRKPGLRIDVVHFAGLDQRIDGGCAITASV